MNKILLIGNSGTISNGTDGQTVKVRLYLKKIKDEGFAVDFVDLENFTKNPFRILLKIKKYYKKCDRVVLLTAERGSKLLIPFINRINRKNKKPFVFPLIGISVLHNSIDHLSDVEKNDFFVNENYSICKPKKKLVKQLRKIDYILPETELLTNAFSGFYGLSNVYQLNNFRENIEIDKSHQDNSGLKLVYVSRVMKIKGIFDLLDVVKSLNEDGYNVFLDIYGNKTLSDEESNVFNSLIDGRFINYRGTLPNDNVCKAISNYDLFVFPTRYYGEGTPGVVVESLIAGVPVITSSFPQATYLLKDGFDSIFYKMEDKNKLKETILNVIKNKGMLDTMRKNAFVSGQKYTYNHERDIFLKYICGVGENK